MNSPPMQTCAECTLPIEPVEKGHTDDDDREVHWSCLQERYERERLADEAP